jgi:AcrR family transcriptional regulator
MTNEKTEHPFGGGSRGGARAATPEPRVTYDDRLNRILEAATGVIAREGYEKASMRAVAKAAGVSLAGLYHYFESKERILFLIQFRTFSSLLNNLQEKLHGVEDPVEQLHVMVKAHVSYFVANMHALKACSHELDTLSGNAYRETLQIRREYYSITRSIIERVVQANGGDGALDLHVATLSLFGTLNWLYRWYNPQQDRSPNTLAHQISTQFLQGVLGAAAPAGDAADT